MCSWLCLLLSVHTAVSSVPFKAFSSAFNSRYLDSSPNILLSFIFVSILLSSCLVFISSLLLTFGFAPLFLTLPGAGQAVYGKACVTVNAPLRAAPAASQSLGIVFSELSFF